MFILDNKGPYIHKCRENRTKEEMYRAALRNREETRALGSG